jgi:hypothetical protein
MRRWKGGLITITRWSFNWNFQTGLRDQERGLSESIWSGVGSGAPAVPMRRPLLS